MVSSISMTIPTKRSTIYFGAELHPALRLKSAETERSMSDLVNDAVRRSLAEDAEDLAALDQRASEPTVAFPTTHTLGSRYFQA